MIFVDTVFFYALASKDDPDHERVREVFKELDPKRLPELWLTPRIMSSSRPSR